MSQLRGRLTPEARATAEAALARPAAPGMCKPLDDTPAWLRSAAMTRSMRDAE
jgi:hypothetical protein